MPQIIKKPAIIEAAGNKEKRIEEFFKLHFILSNLAYNG